MTEVQAPQDTTFYIRNWRPNRLSFKYAQVKYILERRGDRQDTVALPVDAKSDPTIARWMRNGILEDISKENYIELAVRSSDGPFNALRSKAREVDIPIENRNSSTATTIPTELIDSQDWRKKYLSPSLEYITAPLSTEDELGKLREAREAAAKAEEKTTKKTTKG